jgi:hypothetical protein
VAEIIELEDILRARARRRARVLTERCIAILEESLASCRYAYPEAPPGERFVRAHKIRQLEELIAYAAQLP